MSMDNGMVLTGWTQPNADFDPGTGVVTLNNLPFGLFLAKYDTSGNLVYARAVADTMAGQYSSSSFLKIACDHSGNTFMIVGVYGSYTPWEYTGIGFKVNGNMMFDSIPPGTGRYFIIKYGPNGKIRSVKKMALEVELSDLIFDNHDNLIISGHFGQWLTTTTRDLAPGPGVSLFTSDGPDGFIIKMNPAGHLTFIKVLHYVYTGPYNGVIADIFPYNLAVDSKDNIIFSVYVNGLYDVDPGPDTNLVHAAYSSSNENGNFLFEKLDSSGNFVYRKKFFNTKFGMGLKVDANDNIILYGGLGAPIDIAPSNNNSVIITPTHSYGNMLIAKFNNNGLYRYSKLISGNAEASLYDFHITKNNKFFLYASTEDSTTFASAGIPSVGACSPYGKRIIMELDTMFNAFYYDEISNSYDSSAWYPHILSGTQNDIYLCGYYTGRFDADFSPAAYFLENPDVNPVHSVRSGVISKYQFPINPAPRLLYEPGASFISAEKNDDNTFLIYANSSSPPVVCPINNSVKYHNSTFRVFNSAGQQVYADIFSKDEPVQLNLIAGIYFVQISSENKILGSAKLIAY